MRSLLAIGVVIAAGIAGVLPAEAEGPIKIMRVPTQYIAALGDPQATSGEGAETWGLWRRDPGPRGVWLQHFRHLQAAGGVAPAEWVFDRNDWWLDENGLLMEKPEFPLPPGRYVVTGDREAVTMLTVHPEDDSGKRRWELANGVKLHDVTHLPCRSARYTPAVSSPQCTPASAPLDAFKVKPGADMPSVEGCHKQDYAVLFIIGMAVEPVSN
jgi:hypothetical protein